MFRRLRLLAAVPLLALGLAACGSGTLSADKVAKGAEDALEKQVGVRPDITCPEDLKAEVDAKTHCILTAGGDHTKYGVSVTITSVDRDKANFDVAVDDKPAG